MAFEIGREVRETLHISNYEIREELRSQIDPSQTITVTPTMRCPSCKREMPMLSHGEAVKCSCGLHMELWGAGLHCKMRK